MQVPDDILAHIRSAANKHGVDPALVAAIVETESRFDPSAVGDEGMSYGLMQLHLQGAGAGHTPEELLDMATNLDLGTAYLRYNLDRFQGDLRMAVSAYNQGTSGAEQRGWTFNRRYVETVLRAYRGWKLRLSRPRRTRRRKGGAVWK